MPVSIVKFPMYFVAIHDEPGHDHCNDEDEEIYNHLNVLLDELGLRRLDDAFVRVSAPKLRYELRIDGHVHAKSASYLMLERVTVPRLRRQFSGDRTRTIHVFDRRIGAVCLTTNAGGAASSCL